MVSDNPVTMVPLDHVETIDSNNTNSDNCHTTNTNISIVRFQDVADVNDPKGPATKPECTKVRWKEWSECP